jgi:hypothetical protein
MKIHHSKRDLDYIIPKKELSRPHFQKSQIYILEKEITKSNKHFCSSENKSHLHKITSVIS